MEHHLRQSPLVVRREHAGHKSFIDQCLRTGQLVPVLPGVHRWAEVEENFHLRALAAQKWQVNGVLFGSTAAKLLWWPELRDETIRIVSPTARRGVRWLVTSKRVVPDDFIATVAGVRVANPALSVLQMCSDGDGAAVSEGLRRGVVTLSQLWQVFHGRAERSQQNGTLRKVLEEARDEPWSPLELRAHRLLREAGITGWKTNVAVEASGRRFYADILFHDERLIVEIDGRTHHTHRELDADNERRNALIEAGWRVLHFSAATLDTMVEVVWRILKDARSLWKKDRLPLLPVVSAREVRDDGWSGI